MLSSYLKHSNLVCPHEQCVYLTNFIWSLTSNPNCHVTFSKTKMNVNWHLHFLFKCHLNVICLVVHVISISKVSIDVRFFSSQVTLHDKIQIVCVNWCAYYFCASFRMSNVKNSQKFVKKYTLLTDTRAISTFCEDKFVGQNNSSWASGVTGSRKTVWGSDVNWFSNELYIVLGTPTKVAHALNSAGLQYNFLCWLFGDIDG